MNENSGSTTTLAVADGVVVRAAGDSHTSAVESVLAARAGDEARFFEATSDVPDLYEQTGEAHLRLCSTDTSNATNVQGVLEGSTAISYDWLFASEETQFTVAATYPEGDVADAAAVSDHISQEVTPEHNDGFEGSTDGRIVSTTGTLPTDQFALYSQNTSGSDSGTATRPPQVSFDFRYDPSDETLTITHNGGDTAVASRLTVTAEGRPTETQFRDEYVELTAGQSITVDVSGLESGDRVEIAWTNDDESDSYVLATFQLP